MVGGQAGSIVSVEVAGEWSTGDFAAFFAAVDRLYVALYRFQAEGLPLRAGDSRAPVGLGRLTRVGVPPLTVDHVSYASPGSISLLGAGEVLGQLRELIKDLWGRNRQEKAGRAVELEARRVELDHATRMRRLEYLLAQAAVAREFREAGRAAGVPAEEVDAYVRRALGDAVVGLDLLVQEGKVIALGPWGRAGGAGGVERPGSEEKT